MMVTPNGMHPKWVALCAALVVAVSLILSYANTTAATGALKPKTLLIYYGWPSSLNSAVNGWNLANVAADLGQYEYVILGDGLEKASHGDHNNTVTILAHPAMANTFVFGYIDLDVTTQNLSSDEVNLRIDEWKATGADGIFLDDFGYDFATDRARQNAAVSYAHAQGLPVMANAWRAQDAFASEVDPTYNPAGSAPALNGSDFYLSESHQIIVGQYETEANWQNKAQVVAAYQAAISFKVMSVTTNDANDVYAETKFFYAWCSALLYDHEATAWGEYGFAANDAVAPFRERPNWEPGAAFTGDIIAASPSFTRATDRGVIFVNTATHACGINYPITFDATALSAEAFNIDFGAAGGNLNVVTPLPLPPGDYTFFAPASTVGFAFTVTTDSKVDYDTTLDSYVSGRNTATLTISGYPITFDATALSAEAFNLNTGAAGGGLNDQVRTLRLLPGVYTFYAPASAVSFAFTVIANGTVDYDTALDSYVSGRGSNTLIPNGLPITFDATALLPRDIDFSLNFGAAGRRPNQVTSLNLLPGTYTFHAPASGGPFAFTVTAMGTVIYDPQLEADGIVSGQGASQLTVHRMIYVDSDGDGTLDHLDNCRLYPNPDQANFDGDEWGDVCEPDDDNDGIFDTIDGVFSTATGAYTDHSFAVGNDSFTDQQLGGTTYGAIVDRAGLSLIVGDIPEAPGSGGIGTIVSGNPASTALFTACGLAVSVTPDAGSGKAQANFKCGSLTAKVQVGTVRVQLGNNVEVTVQQAAAVQVSEDTQGEFAVENLSTHVGSNVEIRLGTDTVVTVPNDSAALITEVPGGQFEVGNSPASAAAIIVEAGGQTTAIEPAGAGAIDANLLPVCGAATPSLDTLWPPDHKFVAIAILGVIDPDEDAITITIDSITQDEPVDTLGSGNTSPDGQGVGAVTAQVRAERAAGGNGRVYHLGFTASDHHGGLAPVRRAWAYHTTRMRKQWMTAHRGLTQQQLMSKPAPSVIQRGTMKQNNSSCP